MYYPEDWYEHGFRPPVTTYHAKRYDVSTVLSYTAFKDMIRLKIREKHEQRRRK